jgi:hypothetical protein
MELQVKVEKSDKVIWNIDNRGQYATMLRFEGVYLSSDKVMLYTYKCLWFL